jgi:hypothetical protein
MFKIYFAAGFFLLSFLGPCLYLALQTKAEINKVKQECTVLTELLLRKKFRNITEVRPAFSRERRKRNPAE